MPTAAPTWPAAGAPTRRGGRRAPRTTASAPATSPRSTRSATPPARSSAARSLSGLRLLIIAAVVVAGGLLATTLANRDSAPTAAASSDPHADPHIPKAQMARMLNAVSAASSSKPHAELVAQGRAIFRSTTLPKQGESCQGCHTEATANGLLGATAHKMDPAQPLSPSNFDGLRDPPNLVNAGSTAPYFWLGDTPTLEAAAVG